MGQDQGLEAENVVMVLAEEYKRLLPITGSIASKC